MHFKHSAALAKSFIETGINFQFKVTVSPLRNSTSLRSACRQVYPDVDHDFGKTLTVHDDYFHFQRQFFQECLGGRVNKERKLVVPEEYD